ncbi:DUF1648 domain-containing protein [Enterococcus sp. DIV0086]|uniref:DUF1648 domain-containing protein n=1 Tax=Enterococcus sp. DIV0086 TaxID=2774655 RepID=UPI003D2CC3ED
MFNYISKKYHKIVQLNFMWAVLAFLFNLYLFPKLPTIIPNHFQWDGTPDNPGGRFIIWVLPLIFIALSILFSEKSLFKFFSVVNSVLNKNLAAIF